MSTKSRDSLSPSLRTLALLRNKCGSSLRDSTYHREWVTLRSTSSINSSSLYFSAYTSHDITWHVGFKLVAVHLHTKWYQIHNPCCMLLWILDLFMIYTFCSVHVFVMTAAKGHWVGQPSALDITSSQSTFPCKESCSHTIVSPLMLLFFSWIILV